MGKKILIGIVVLVAIGLGLARLVNATTVEVTNQDGSTQRVANSELASVSPNVSLDKTTGAPLITTGVPLTSDDVTQLALWILGGPDDGPVCEIVNRNRQAAVVVLMEDVEAGVAGNGNTLDSADLRTGTSAALSLICP